MLNKTLKPSPYFIIGTDTEVGKTYVTCQLMHHLSQNNHQVLGLKPVAAGTNLLGQNEDALALQKASTVKCPYEIINPIALSTAASPHIAADIDSELVSVKRLMKVIEPGLAQAADYTFIEGAGGWFCPINHTETLACFAKAVNFPVIMVVGIKLGCLNHALLTAASLQAAKLPLAGWIANRIEPNNAFVDENIELLSSKLSAPLLAEVAYKGGLMDLAEAALT